MPQLTADTLLNLGFRDVAVWALSKGEDGIEYRLDGANAQADKLLLDETNSLYAFVHGEQVKYIGKTARTVRERFVGYRNPSQRQRTNWRCNGKIREMLKAGEVVRIFVFNPISYLRYGDFDINLAAGLEDSLITEFKPPWNGSERGRPISEEAEREKEEEVTERPKGTQSVDLPHAPIANPVGVASFQIVLGEAYYHQGFINPGVAASSYLGNDGEPIEVNFGDETPPVTSRINRTANKSGGVRIVGRNARIAEWFQRYFSRGDVVEARVLGRNSILLLPKS